MAIVNELPSGISKEYQTVLVPIYNPTPAQDGLRSYTFTQDYEHVVAIYYSGSYNTERRTPSGAYTNVDSQNTIYQKASAGSSGSAQMTIVEARGVKNGSTFAISGTGYQSRGMFIFEIQKVEV